MVGIRRSVPFEALQLCEAGRHPDTAPVGRPEVVVQSSVKPFLFGYLRIRITAGLTAADAGRRVLRTFADTEGFTLVDVYVDADENEPMAALVAMIRCIRTADADRRGLAVAIPHLSHLGADLATQRRMRAWVQHQTQVRLIVIRS